MQRLVVSCEVRLIYTSLGAKGLVYQYLSYVLSCLVQLRLGVIHFRMHCSVVLEKGAVLMLIINENFNNAL